MGGDKMEPFHTEACDDFKVFLSKVEKITNQGWMFRGQRKDSWQLAHKFERACERFNIDGNQRLRVETNMIREFKRRLHHYTENIPSFDSTDEWMALMQHHGAPTRLLDFTYSPYVAAYFAFEFAKPNSEVAIWAVNFEWCQKHLESISKELSEKYEAYQKKRQGKVFDSIFRKKNPEMLVLSVNPFRLNERLAYQRGVFLCPGNIEVDFMKNLSAYIGTNRLNDKVIKFTIQTGHNNEYTIEVLENLDTMNISRITLFPGLDGFAQSFEPRSVSLFLKQYRY